MKASIKQKIMKDILEIKDGTIHNHAGLEIIEKDGNLYVSGNEVNEVLKDTKYEVCELVSYFQCNIPLFNESGMCDLLIDIYSLNLFITRSHKYKRALNKIYVDKSFIESRRLPIRNKAMDFRDINEIKAMALSLSENLYHFITLNYNYVESHDKYTFLSYGIKHYLKYFRLKKRDWTIEDLGIEIRNDLKLGADKS